MTASTASATASGGSTDPWALATSSSYDPDTIYTRASDAQGHSAIVHAKMSTTVHAELRALVESRVIPELRTTADVVRDALIHRLIKYQNMLKARGLPTGTLSATINTEVREAQLDRIERQHIHWAALIDKLDARLGECLRLKDWDTAYFIIENNGDPDDMTEPFALRLAEVLSRRTRELRSMAERLPGIDAPRSNGHDPS